MHYLNKIILHTKKNCLSMRNEDGTKPNLKPKRF